MTNLFKFDFSNLKGDFFGGITAGIVALPLALAFGVQSGMGADAGLYGAIMIGIVAAFFGGTPTQISGPTAPMTVISTVLVSNILNDFNGVLVDAVPTILLVFLMAGIFQVMLGVLRLGTYIKYIPYPVVSGFMTGIGVIILIGQIFPFFGYQPAKDEALIDRFVPQAEAELFDEVLETHADRNELVIEEFDTFSDEIMTVSPERIRAKAAQLASAKAKTAYGTLRYANRAFDNINWLELLLALATIGIIYGFRYITRKIPSALVALVVVTGAVMLLDLEARTIRDIGEIPFGFPPLRYDIFANFSIAALVPYIGTALTLAGLGAIDSLLTSVVADNLTKTQHDSNQELIGQGIGNGVAAIFGGIPGAGATIRTVVNINAGGKTRISGMLAGTLLLFILLALGPLASSIPLGVLAGILITVGIGVIDYRGLRALPKMPRGDAAVLLVVLFLTVFLDLILAVGIGMVLAALMFMKKMGDRLAQDSRLSSLDTTDDKAWADEFDLPRELAEEVFVKHLDGPLFFGSSNEFQRLTMQVPATASHVILRMDEVPYIDQSGLYTLEEVVRSYQERGVKVLVVGLQPQPLMRMRSIGLLEALLPKEQIFANMRECITYVKANVADTV